MSNYTTTDIGKLAGVTRKTVGKYIKDHGIEPVTQHGNIPKYSEKTKNEIVNHYGNADNQKIDSSKIDNELLAAKDETIHELKEEIKRLDKQIDSLNMLLHKTQDLTENAQKLTRGAQQLNYMDKDKDNLEIEDKKDSKPKKKHWWNLKRD